MRELKIEDWCLVLGLRALVFDEPARDLGLAKRLIRKASTHQRPKT
jgi:hypothetical protein